MKRKSIVRVALLQIAACGNDQEANLRKGEAFCRQAKEMQADIVLFPEMWNIGYQLYSPGEDGPTGNVWRSPECWREAPPATGRDDADALERWEAQAIPRDAEFVTHFRSLARELQMAIALTYLEKWDGAPRNAASLIGRNGEILLTYAKVHTCDFGMGEWACTPGDGFHVADVDTDAGPVRCGVMICYDREFPESARILMLKGAELILTPNACRLDQARLAQFRTRAYENMLGVAMTNYPAPKNNGHSVAYDPMIDDGNGRPRDTLLVEAGEHEGIYPADFDREAIRRWRRQPWGNAFRRPHRYGLLTSMAVEPPFVRVNSRNEAYDRGRR